MRKIWILAMVLFMASSIGTLAANGLNISLDSGQGALKVGEVRTVKLMFDSGSNYVSGLTMSLTVNSLIKVNKVTLNNTNFSVVQESSINGSEIKLTAYNFGKKTVELPRGVFEVATLEVEGLSAGKGVISLISDQIVGNDGTNPLYFEALMTGGEVVVEEEVPPVEIVGNGTDGVLKFIMTYGGVVNGAKCARNWPATVIVADQNDKKTVFNNVTVAPIASNNSMQEYLVQILLSGVENKNNLSVFVKGPKQIQTKYGVNKQGAYYSQAGGKISVEVDPAKTTVYDFTGYSVMPGDVTGPNGVQDGLVDGLDFSYVKSQVVKRSEGNNMLADLNGNCKLESQDLVSLMLTLKERQEQLY